MSTASIAELDAQLGTPQFDADPLDVLRRLREEDPVHWSDAIGGWLVTRYDDVVTTFKDIAHFSNEGRPAKATAYLSPELRSQFKPLEDHYHIKGILHADPPDHTRLRALILTAFNPKVVAAMRPRIQAIVDDLFDRAAERGGMEVIGDLAWALPSTVLADLLAAPIESRPLFKRWANEIMAFQGVNKPSVDVLVTAQSALLDAKDYLRGMIEERRRDPREDLLSHLVTAEADGSTLSEPELLSTCITLLGGGAGNHHGPHRQRAIPALVPPGCLGAATTGPGDRPRGRRRVYSLREPHSTTTASDQGGHGAWWKASQGWRHRLPDDQLGES